MSNGCASAGPWRKSNWIGLNKTAGDEDRETNEKLEILDLEINSSERLDLIRKFS